MFFVGLEPAIKPAVQLTQNKKIAMLITQRTVDSTKYQALIQRTINEQSGVQLQSIACVGWAQAIDTGQVSGQTWTNLLTQYLELVRIFGADVVVLGCTHYPFIADDIRAYLGEGIMLLDSGAPVARVIPEVFWIYAAVEPWWKKLGQTRNYATCVDDAVRARWQYFSDAACVELSPLSL